MRTMNRPTLNRHSKSANPIDRLGESELAEIAAQFDALHDEVFSNLGDRDARYIRAVIRFQRHLTIASRAVLLASRWKPAWVVGTAGLALAKILENMEIGHNVMHGQWDWMRDPEIHSASWDWDNVSPAAAWKHSHNVVHHTFTNVIGKDHDVGYELLRIDPRQRWKPRHLTQPVSNLLLMALFEWGVASHDLDVRAVRSGAKSRAQLQDELRAIGVKIARQVAKDYVAFPLLSGRSWRSSLLAAVVANIVRNVWAHAIIFCGHFPDQAYTFTEEEVVGESRGGWYVRQLIGSVDIEGRPLFHLLAGNLSFQVEHHLFPDMPSSRYAQIATRVKEICEQHGLPYNGGRLGRQWWSVQRSILRLAFPGGGERPKAPPYVRADDELAGDLLAEIRLGIPAFP